MDYSVENLEKAVTLFYKTEAGQQAEAHRWLTEAQNSPQAWSFVWELLDPRRSSEVQFFAATTLHTKLLKCWNEIPEDHYDLLKKRILEAIVTYAMGPKLVLNRLCIALSAYIIHTVPGHWPNAFEELVSSFQPHHLPTVDPQRVVWILLEILSVIPEEFQSTILASSQRARVRTVLQNVTKDILKVTEMCLTPLAGGNYNAASLLMYLNSARCISAWIQLGGVTVEDCSYIVDLLVDLTCYVYWSKTDTESMNLEELELVEIALEAVSSVMLHPQTHKHTGHVFRHTFNILDRFGKILVREGASRDPNKDVVTNVYSLIISVADAHAKLLIGHLRSDNTEEQKLIGNLLECVLSCSDLAGSYPVDETCSSLTFGFWYTLQDDILSLDAAECTELLLLVKPYYRRLVCVMLRKSTYPNNWDDCADSHQWSLDDKETFRCYRQDIADTFMYCYNILNLEMLDILQSKLSEALDECAAGNPGSYWNAAESCLHAFASVSECIEWENLYLPKLMRTLGNIPYGDLHVKVLATALDTVGAYSEWLADHPEAIGNAIQLLMSGLGSADVAPNATMALKDVSQNCKAFLPPFADHLLLMCQSALHNEQLKLAEKTRIMHSLGTILSVQPMDKIMECLNVIVGSSVEEMRTLVNSPGETAGATTSIATRLKMMSALFGTLHVKIPESAPHLVQQQQQQPVLFVVQNTLPLYAQIAVTYYGHAETMDILCTLLKHTVTTLMDDCKPLVPDILQLLIGLYARAPRPAILNLTKTILIMFGKDEKLSGMLCQFLYETVNGTLQMCAQLSSADRLSEKSDIVEGFFSMLTQLLKKNARLVLVCGIDSGALFQCAIVCLSLPELQALKACASFLVGFVSSSRENDQAHVVQRHGESLINRMLVSLGGPAPRSVADVFADVLLALNKKYCDNLSRWLNTQLAQEGFPSHLVTSGQKEHFAKSILKEKANKRKLTESVTEFTLICRGIVKLDGAQ